MNKRLKPLFLALVLIAAISAALADPITMLDGFDVQAGKVGLTSDKVELRSSGGTGKATIKFADSSSNTRLFTWPDVANSSPVMTAGTQTIAGVKTYSDVPVFSAGATFSTAPTITGGLTAANIQSGSAKRELLHYQFASNVVTHTAADSVTYSALLFPGRAGTVTRVTFGDQTPPAGGTNALKVLKASSAGNTMLNAATFDANTLTANTATQATLTATSADLGVTAAQGIYVEYAGAQSTTDAIDLEVTIEFEPTDF